MILCPECGTVNPPIRIFSNTHDGEQCRSIIGTKNGFWGQTINKYCNFIGSFDEGDDWHYVNMREDGNIVLVRESDFYSIYKLKNIFLGAERILYKPITVKNTDLRCF